MTKRIFVAMGGLLTAGIICGIIVFWMRSNSNRSVINQPQVSENLYQNNQPSPDDPNPTRSTDVPGNADGSLTVDQLLRNELEAAEKQAHHFQFPEPDLIDQIEEEIVNSEDDCAVYNESLHKIAALRFSSAQSGADPGLLAVAADLYLVERKQEVLKLQISLLESVVREPVSEHEDPEAISSAVDVHKQRLLELSKLEQQLRIDAAAFPGRPLRKPDDAYRLLSQTMWSEVAEEAERLLEECEHSPKSTVGIRDLVEQAMGLADDEAHGHSVGSLTFARKYARVLL